MGRARGGVSATTGAGGQPRTQKRGWEQERGRTPEPFGDLTGPSEGVCSPALRRAWEEDRAAHYRPLYHEITRENMSVGGTSDNAVTSYAGATRETWRLHAGGPLHREEAPALIETRPDGTRIEVYYLFGERHWAGDAPAYFEERADGTRIYAYFTGDLRHRDGDLPAYVETNPDGTHIERFFHHDRPHHPGGGDSPSSVERYPDGPYVRQADTPDGGHTEAHYLASALHRDDGPALIETWAGGGRRDSYYTHGELHRLAGPSQVEVRSDGTTVERWHQRGRLHREDGPALIKAFADGSRLEIYYRDGHRHREDGPAFIQVEADGQRSEVRYLRGKPQAASGQAIFGAVIDGTRSSITVDADTSNMAEGALRDFPGDGWRQRDGNRLHPVLISD